MDSGFYSAFTALAARMQSLDLVANNLANANTVGYKGEHEFFRAMAASINNTHITRYTAENRAINNYSVLGGAHLDLTQGSIDMTGNNMDMAIDGPGFFAMQTDSGEMHYTRNGTFRLNALRQIVDHMGDPLQGQQGPIVLPQGEFSVADDGTVSVRGAVVDKVKVVDFPKGTAIVPVGNSDFTAPQDAEIPAENAKVRQGALEASNANPVTMATSMIDLQRNAEMVQKALSIFDSDFNQTAVQELPKL